MKVTRLAHSGLIFENGNATVFVDPISIGGEDGVTKTPVSEAILDKRPDIVVITSSAEEHFDRELIARISDASEKPILFLACASVYRELTAIAKRHTCTLFAPHSVWSERGITFYATHAETADRSAIGVILDDGAATYYVSGPTLYNFDVIDEVLELVEEGVDCAFLPISGKGTVMNAKDAADFAYEIGAKRAVPVGYGIFDSTNPEAFDFDDALTVKPLEPIEI